MSCNFCLKLFSVLFLWILSSVVCPAMASDDLQFIDEVNIAIDDLKIKMEQYIDSGNSHDLSYIGSAANTLYSSANNYLDNIEFFTLSSNLNELKTTYRYALIHIRDTGKYGRDGVNSYSEENQDLINTYFASSMEEFGLSSQYLDKCKKQIDDYSSLQVTTTKPISTQTLSTKKSSEVDQSNKYSKNYQSIKEIKVDSKIQSSTEKVCDCSSDLYNCKGDFPLSNGASADECYKYCISQGEGDIHDLDRDNDDDACEPGWGE